MAQQLTTRSFGPPIGAAGVDVLERSSGNALANPRYGAIALYGVLKRGPIGVCVPVRSRQQYNEIYGDPSDPRYHLYANGAHLTPDAVDGFFATGGGAGTLWITRIQLGNERRASVVLKNRFGSDALRIDAANEGRWGGQKNQVPDTPVVFATSRTFTLVAPGVLANEFIGAEAHFSGAPGKRYAIVANTAAMPGSGEVIFTVSAQYDLIADGVAGPVALAGTAAYARYRTLTGSIAFPLYINAAGTVNINGTVLTGTGTAFLTELRIGSNVYFGGEARVVTSITSNTTATISAPFTAGGTGVTIQIDNLRVTGTATAFQAELEEGDLLYVNISGQLQGRVVEEIISDTSLRLASGYTDAVSPGTQAQADNLTVTGTATQFTTELQVGQFIVDPNRAGQTVRVVAIADDATLMIDKPFSANFSAAQLTRQNQIAGVTLAAAAGQGLSVEVGQGLRFPATHFSLTIKFNGSQVLSIPDASLDPEDPQGLFVEPLVNDSNVAYQKGSTNYQKYITAESLWTAAYTTTPDADCRPCNGAGEILEISRDTLYTVAEFDYARAVGNFLYPNPYEQPRAFFRTKAGRAPLPLQGTISSTGVAVTGTETNFNTVLAAGDYLYDPNSNTVRRIRVIHSATSLTLETAFATNIPPLTAAKRAGHLKIDQGYDLTQVAQRGDRFLVAYPTDLERGYDGDIANILPFHYTQYADVDRNHLENATFGLNQGLIRIATPGISDIGIQRAFAAYASAKAYEYRVELPSTLTSVPAAEAYIVNSIGRDDFITAAFPSYGYISNPLAAGDRMVSLSGDIMGGESARAVEVQGYHDPFAGINAILTRINRLPYESNPTDEAILNVSGLQPIKIQDGRVVVFGARSPSRSPTYDFTHIRRIQSNYVRIFLEARTLMELLFRPNQPQLADQIVMVLNNFARREYRKGVMSNYLSFAQAVQIQGELDNQGVISDLGSQDALVQIINGRLKIRFRYIPTGILERLTIEAGPDILVAQFGNTLTQSAV